MLKHILIPILMVSSVALFAQLNISGTTVGAPTANFPNIGATPAACSGINNEPYRVFTFKATNTTTITVNFTNIIDAGGMTDDTGFSWYTGTFNPANTCANFIAIGENLGGTNKTINVTANTNYAIVVIGFFGTQDGFAGTLTAAAGTVLSIELSSFTAKNTEGGQNLLTWATASEKNNSHFDIERSTDGSSFLSIGQVKGNNKPSSYQYTDATPPLGIGGLYYRLRQMDFDGTEALSKVVSVSLKGNTKSLKVYPTIVSTGILTVETDGTSTDYREGVQLRDFSVTNLLGQQVLSGKTPPSGTFGLDVSALARGTYIFKVGAEQVKFFKQ